MSDIVIIPSIGSLAFTSSNGEIIDLSITESVGRPLLVISGTNLPILHFSSSVLFENGLTGSLTEMFDGSPYLEGQGTVTVLTASDGHIIISGTGDGGSGGGSGPDADWTDNGNNLSTTSSLNVENNGFFSGVVSSSLGFTGSLTQLIDGSPYIEGQGTVTVLTASNGHLIISGTGDGGGGGSSVTTTDLIWTPDLAESTSSFYDRWIGTEALDGKWLDWDPDGIMTVITSSNSCLILSSSNASGACSGIYQLAPTGSFMMTAKVSMVSPGESVLCNAGIMFAQDLTNNPTSADIKAMTFFIFNSVSGFARQAWADYNSFSSEATKLTATGPISGYLRLVFDSNSTTYHGAYSADGRGWRFVEFNDAAGFTPETVGLFLTVNSGIGVSGYYEWFDLVTGSFSPVAPIEGKLVRYVEE